MPSHSPTECDLTCLVRERFEGFDCLWLSNNSLEPNWLRLNLIIANVDVANLPLALLPPNAWWLFVKQAAALLLKANNHSAFTTLHHCSQYVTKFTDRNSGCHANKQLHTLLLGVTQWKSRWCNCFSDCCWNRWWIWNPRLPLGGIAMKLKSFR